MLSSRTRRSVAVAVVGLVVSIGFVVRSDEPDDVVTMSRGRDRPATSDDLGDVPAEPDGEAAPRLPGREPEGVTDDPAGDETSPPSPSGDPGIGTAPQPGGAEVDDPGAPEEPAKRPAGAPAGAGPVEGSAPGGGGAAGRAFPTKATTGHRACKRSADDLTPMSGPVEVGAGEVLENFDLRGHVTVTGKGAVIRCGRIRSGSLYAIAANRSGDESFTIEDVEMEGIASDQKMNSAAIAPYGRWTARRVDVWRFKDGIKLGSNQTVEQSWIHDLWKVKGSHNDGMQSVGGRQVVIRGNNIEGPWQSSTSALILGAGSVGYLEDYTIEGNRLSGGGYSVYIGGGDGNPTPQGITVRDNVWVRGSSTYGPLSVRLGWPAGDRGRVWAGNVYDDGSAVPLS